MIIIEDAAADDGGYSVSKLSFLLFSEEEEITYDYILFLFNMITYNRFEIQRKLFSTKKKTKEEEEE